MRTTTTIGNDVALESLVALEEVLALRPCPDKRSEAVHRDIFAKAQRGELTLPRRIAETLALHVGGSPMS